MHHFQATDVSGFCAAIHLSRCLGAMGAVVQQVLHCHQQIIQTVEIDWGAILGGSNGLMEPFGQGFGAEVIGMQHIDQALLLQAIAANPLFLAGGDAGHQQSGFLEGQNFAGGVVAAHGDDPTGLFHEQGRLFEIIHYAQLGVLGCAMKSVCCTSGGMKGPVNKTPVIPWGKVAWANAWARAAPS
jgi:hypothetical protein